MQIDHSTAAIVTGGASGLGEATARLLCQKGVKVGILDMQEERGRAVAKELGAVFHLCDVTNEASVAAALAAIRAINGQERILANCAGIAPGKRMISKHRETGVLMAHDLAHFVRVVNVNLIGSFLVTAQSAYRAQPDGATIHFLMGFIRPHAATKSYPNSLQLPWAERVGCN